MAETNYQEVARRQYPRARLITGNGQYALLRSPDVILFENWTALYTAKQSGDSWVKLQTPAPRFKPGIARFRKMVESA